MLTINDIQKLINVLYEKGIRVTRDEIETTSYELYFTKDKNKDTRDARKLIEDDNAEVLFPQHKNEIEESLQVSYTVHRSLLKDASGEYDYNSTACTVCPSLLSALALAVSMYPHALVLADIAPEDRAFTAGIEV